jgi:hypothetical protein
MLLSLRNLIEIFLQHTEFSTRACEGALELAGAFQQLSVLLPRATCFRTSASAAYPKTQKCTPSGLRSAVPPGYSSSARGKVAMNEADPFPTIQSEAWCLALFCCGFTFCSRLSLLALELSQRL